MAETEALDIQLIRKDPYMVAGSSGIHVFNDGKSALLIKKGKLYAYGEKDIRMGISDYKSAMERPTRVQYLSNDGVQAISTGMTHTVLLDSNGVIWCWGSNTEGQLGAGHEQDITSPFKPELQKNTVHITCGPWFTLITDIRKEVWYWGKLSETIKSSLPVKLTIPNGMPVISITAGLDHAAMLTENGEVYTWGENVYGQLGVNNNYAAAAPQLVNFSDPPKKFSAIMASSVFTAFLTTEGLLYMSGKLAGYYGLQSTELYGDIVSLTGSWASSVVGVTVLRQNKHVIYEIGRHVHKSCFLAMETNYNSALEMFKDYVTPMVHKMKAECSLGIIDLMGLENIHNYCEKSTLDVQHLYNNKDWSDLEIDLSDEVIFAHKIVLSNKSKGLKKLINEMSPAQLVLDMTNCNASTYRAFIKYLYTGKLEIDSVENFLELYILALKDENQSLKNICLIHWIDSIDVENVISLFHLACEYKIKDLGDACGPVLYQNFLHLLTTPEYAQSPAEIKLILANTVAKEGLK